MNATEWCRVVTEEGKPCGKSAVAKVEVMQGKPSIPVCEIHQRKPLWWYRGTVFTR